MNLEKNMYKNKFIYTPIPQNDPPQDIDPQMILKPFRSKSGRGSGLEDPAMAAFNTGLIGLIVLVPYEDKSKKLYIILVIFF